jgi:hypothetical protein
VFSPQQSAISRQRSTTRINAFTRLLASLLPSFLYALCSMADGNHQKSLRLYIQQKTLERIFSHFRVFIYNLPLDHLTLGILDLFFAGVIHQKSLRPGILGKTDIKRNVESLIRLVLLHKTSTPWVV